MLSFSRIRKQERRQPVEQRVQRCGVPAVCPKFADVGPLRKHGFARLRTWRWSDGDQPQHTATRAVLQLGAEDEGSAGGRTCAAQS